MTKKDQFIKKNNKYIRNDLESALLYYDFIFSGVKMFKLFDSQFSRILTHKVLRIALKAIFLFRVNYFIFTSVRLEGDFIIKINGNGQWPSEVTVFNSDGKLYVKKKVAKRSIFLKEESFYETYKDVNSQIRLPKYNFESNRCNIVTEFVRGKSLDRMLNEGVFSFQDSMKIFESILNDLNAMYGPRNPERLIHGDLSTLNILINKDHDSKKPSFFLIDYSDCFLSVREYDAYVLLKSFLCNFQKIKRDDFIVGSEYKDLFLSKLGIRNDELERVEKIFFGILKKKHPKTYRHLRI